MLIRNSKTLRPYLFRAFYDWFIDSNITLHIVVKLDEKGVQIPVKFKGQAIITLSITPAATRNFEIGEEDISFNAKFSGVDEFIVIPYTAMLNFIDVEDQIAFPIREVLLQDLPSDYFSEGDEDEEVKKEESKDDDDDLFSTVEEVIDIKDSNKVKDLSNIKDKVDTEEKEDLSDDRDDLFSFVKPDPKN